MDSPVNSLIVFGDKVKITKLFENLRNVQDGTNPDNQVTIVNTNAAKDDDEFLMLINTRYYETNARLYLYEQHGGSFDSVKSKHGFNGFIVHLSHEAPDLDFFSEDIRNFSKGNESLLKLILVESFSKLNEKDQARLTDLSQQLGYDILKFDEEDDYIGEFKNLIYVHEWHAKSLKNLKPSHRASNDYSVSASHASEANKRVHGDLSVDAEDDEVSSKLFNNSAKEEEFESILMNLKSMRDKAGQMSLEERKNYAENVVKTFWSAIGGDENELFSTDEDEEK